MLGIWEISDKICKCILGFKTEIIVYLLLKYTSNRIKKLNFQYVIAVNIRVNHVSGLRVLSICTTSCLFV